MPEEDDKNSVCSNDSVEEVEVKDKDAPKKKKVLKKVVKYVIGDEDNSDDDEGQKLNRTNEDDEEADGAEEDEDEDEEEEDDEDDDDEDEDDDEEFDPAIIQYELLKNFLVDEEGNNVATHLGSIAHELRRLNKVLLKKEK